MGQWFSNLCSTEPLGKDAQKNCLRGCPRSGDQGKEYWMGAELLPHPSFYRGSYILESVL